MVKGWSPITKSETPTQHQRTECKHPLGRIENLINLTTDKICQALSHINPPRSQRTKDTWDHGPRKRPHLFEATLDAAVFARYHLAVPVL